MNEIVSDEILNLPITHLAIGNRAYSALARLDVALIGDIIGKTEVELLRMSNVGKATVREIKEALREYGVYVMGEEPPFTAAEKAEAILQFARIAQSMTKEELTKIFTHRRG